MLTFAFPVRAKSLGTFSTYNLPCVSNRIFFGSSIPDVIRLTETVEAPKRLVVRYDNGSYGNLRTFGVTKHWKSGSLKRLGASANF